MDLILFEIPDFDMILEIDFLGRNGAEIDCQVGKVQFSFKDGDQFKFDKGLIRSMMISALRHEKC